MGSIKIEELMEEKRVGIARKATRSLEMLTETMKSLMAEAKRLSDELEKRKCECQSQ